MANTNLTNQRQVFVEEYVRSGDHLEAAKKAGYKDTHTLRNQACKLRRECADQITDELHRNFAEIAPRALNILSDLAENAESESVRLGATRDLLDTEFSVYKIRVSPDLYFFLDTLKPSKYYSN
jgi:hypothetical protein